MIRENFFGEKIFPAPLAFMNSDLTQIKNFLIDSRLVTKKVADEAEILALESDRTLEDVLVSEGAISDDDFRRVKSHLIGIPFVDLKKEKVAKDILALIPEPIARKHNLVAYRRTEQGLEVAMLDPLDLEAINFVKKSLGLKILPRLTDTESIRNLLIQYQKSLKINGVSHHFMIY